MKQSKWSIKFGINKLVKVIVYGCAVYIAIICLSLMIPKEVFPGIAGYTPEDVNWCHYISGNGWYMVKIEEDNVSFVRFSPITNLLPSHVVKLSDVATYNLSQACYKERVGWDDADFIESPDQEICISVKLHDVKNGSLYNSILLLKIAKSCSDIWDECDFAQIVTTRQGSKFFVSVFRQSIE